MKKRMMKTILSGALAMVLAGTGFSAGFAYVDARAEGEAAQIGEKTYVTLGEALADWTENTELKLLSAATLSAPLSVTESKSLDLNGYTLSGNGEDSVLRVTGGVFDLKDTSTARTGAVTGGSAERGGGIFVGEGATVNLQGGSVRENSAEFGGGVFVSEATLNISAQARIDGNTAEAYGGGVFVSGITRSAVVNVLGGEISGNSAEFGGGVAIWTRGTVNFGGSSKISGNEAIYGGGGAYVQGIVKANQPSQLGIFEMKDSAVITGNRVTGTGDFQVADGGGVKVADGGEFHMSGGSVNANEALVSGGGVSIETGGKAVFGGSAQVVANMQGELENNVFLMQENTVSIQSGFSGKLGFNMNAFGVIASGVSEMGENLFSADNEDYALYLDNGSLRIRSMLPDSVIITTLPDKLVYEVGQPFRPDGMVVFVKYTDGHSEQVENYKIENGASFAADDLFVNVVYSSRGKTVRTRLYITVRSQNTAAGNTSETNGGNPFGFIAVVTLSILFVIALIVVGIITDGFKGRKKAAEGPSDEAQSETPESEAPSDGGSETEQPETPEGGKEE